ncbi:hypothetical protein GV794_25010 [Nocardia cyriacigeorgica]|uniref:DUF3093 domain-containing protein n=1 Tax=Nocardia cyriacigeorgica TaxID=135487 RepID=A0A6P1DC23_9NOCA|nr:hypothetical protein [Nocardia cyriacigeorgica]NEW39482.1 hypothetical protein [Nocardia cyriacigeorgica]NEW47141.1 hypothetical protein [Nocardia cyriacigeorgica]NEW53771.1 hypothetical protein [Nocardia cyriacigeorgica]NEW58873.1 hypothetical protein [Nocardia cyriacigeorgica]
MSGAVTSDSATILFAEPGGRWRSVAYGPALCLLILVLELATGSSPHWFALLFCGALIAAFVALQVVAARRHISVELTPEALRNGTETLPLDAIDAVLGEADEQGWDEEPLESARALGELSGVPRRRTGIGLRRTDGDVVQAWARDHRGMRAALSAALDKRTPRSSDGHGGGSPRNHGGPREAADPTPRQRPGENGADR